MSATNRNALSRYAGILEVVQYPTSTCLTSPDCDQTEIASFLASINTLSWRRIASITDLKITRKNGETLKVETDDNGTIWNSATPDVMVDATWYETFEPELHRILFNDCVVYNPGTPVNVIAELLCGDFTPTNTAGLVVAFKNYNETNVTSVAVKSGGTPLVLNTDYKIVLGSDGYTHIVPLIANTGVITIDYTYTPAVAAYVMTEIKDRELPNLIIRIKARNPINGKEQIVVIVNAVIDGELSMGFVDPTRAGELANSKISFKANRGGKIIYCLGDI